ncbi:ABC transporter substrate-binding protein [Paraoerskovia marina]|uniref:ABC transporter substrate-binding protein n=1 Tax=Paraoerskovia marina TaxID=545619 RepID=UPI0005BC2908|nr:ABC transporter substrate-binding protein [Paraoerskovia marina]
MSTTSRRQNRRGRGTFAAAILGIGALALTACSGGTSAEELAGGGAASESSFDGEYDGPAVELSYWTGFTGGDGPFMNQMVEEFNAEHENIDVVSNAVDWSDFYAKLPAAVQAGEGPDVGAMHLDQLATNAARSVIAPVDGLADGIGLTADDFTAELWDAGIYQGKRYGIPLDVHSLAMYYNAEHFEAAGIDEPPTDKSSFMDALDKLQAAGFEQPFWMPSLWPAHLEFLSLDWQNGGEPYAADGSAATYDDEAGVEALEWQRGIVDAGYSPSDVAIDSQYVAFKNGETSITWDGIWQINDLKATDLSWEMAPIPTIGDAPAVWANSHNFFITTQASADEDRFAASQVFIAWMSEHSDEWAGSGMIPARTSVREGGALDGLPQQAIADRIDEMRFLPAVPGLGGVQAETLEPAVAGAILGDEDPQAALADEAGKATELMEQNLETFGG